MPESVNIESLTADPQFQALPVQQQRQVLWRADPTPFMDAADRAYGLPPNTLKSVWTAESGPGTEPKTVKSRTGVRGPFQITSDFWKDYGGGQPYSTDPFSQMDVAGRGLAALQARHSGDLTRVFAAYGDPEDKTYAQRVMKLKQGFDAQTAPAQVSAPSVTTTPVSQPSLGTRLLTGLRHGEESAESALRDYLDLIRGTPEAQETTVPERLRIAGRAAWESGLGPALAGAGAGRVLQYLPGASRTIQRLQTLAGRAGENLATGVGQAGQVAERQVAGAAAAEVPGAIASRLATRAGETAESAAAAERGYSSRIVTQNERALGRTTLGASGESAASAEALSRMASEKAAGRLRYRVDVRSGKQTPLLGPDAVDAVAGPNEVIIQHNVGQGAGPTVLSQGGNVTDATVKRAGARGYFTLPKPMTTQDYPQVFLALRKENERVAQAAVDFDRQVTAKVANLGPSALSKRLAGDPDLLNAIQAHATPTEWDAIQRAVTAGQPLSKMPWTADQLTKIGEEASTGRGIFGGLVARHPILGTAGIGSVGHLAYTHPGPAMMTTLGLAAVKSFDAMLGTKSGVKILQWLGKATPGSLAATAGTRALAGVGTEVGGPRRLQR